MASKLVRIAVNVAALGGLFLIATGEGAKSLAFVAIARATPLFTSEFSQSGSNVNVPEPSSLALLIAGVAALSFIIARSRRQP